MTRSTGLFDALPVQNVHNGTYRRIESVTAGALTLKVRYNNEEVVLVVIPSFQRLSPSGDGFYLTLSSVLYVFYGERVEKASPTGHAGAHAGYDAPQ